MSDPATTKLKDIESTLEKFLAVPGGAPDHLKTGMATPGPILTPLRTLFTVLNAASGDVDAADRAVKKGLNDAGKLLRAVGDQIVAVVRATPGGIRPADALSTLQAAVATAQTLFPNSTELAAGSKLFGQLAELVGDVGGDAQAAADVLYKFAQQLDALASTVHA
jgi:hypothetical protein